MKFLNSLECSGSSFSKGRWPLEDVNIIVREGLQAFSAMEMTLYISKVSLGVKKKSVERVVVPTRKLRT